MSTKMLTEAEQRLFKDACDKVDQMVSEWLDPEEIKERLDRYEEYMNTDKLTERSDLLCAEMLRHCLKVNKRAVIALEDRYKFKLSQENMDLLMLNFNSDFADRTEVVMTRVLERLHDEEEADQGEEAGGGVSVGS